VCSDDGMRFDVVTKASPEQVHRAFTDFSDRRPQIWAKTLDPRTYELRELGDTWAVARESTSGSPFWVVAHYDWSDPAVIHWTVVECSWGGDGDGFVRIAPADGGGSRVHAEWTNTNPRRQRLSLFLMNHLPLNRMLSRMWTFTLDRHAAEP
jgi:hypothetical protein